MKTVSASPIALALVMISVVAGCSSAVRPNSARVTFVPDADFCGAMFIEQSIDGTVVSSDTMTSRAQSRVFVVSSGSHVLGARRVMTSGGRTNYFLWPDTTIAVEAGASVTRTLALYCS